MKMFTNLAKAALAVAATPVTAVVDVLTIPASAEDPHRGVFDRTGAMLNRVADCFDAATKPEPKEPQQ